MSLTIRDHSIVSLLTILVTSTQFDEIIKIAFVEGKMTKKLNIVLSIIQKKTRAMEDINLGKLIDRELMLHYVFPMIIMSLEDHINEMLVGLMEITAEKKTNGDYVKFCDASKKIVDDFKKIKQVLEFNEVFPEKMKHFRQYK